MESQTITLAEYLFRRLVQLGCKSLHGLPGDFNLVALDWVEKSGLRWVGNCNELNAGYAADAYARVTGLGAIMTTFGVGELSAVNAIAGAYAELAPVVHIVGTPPREAQEKHMFLHHTLGTGDYQTYARIHKEITIAQADLLDIGTAPSEIDRVLHACYVESRPVYIQLPTDMVNQHVPSNLLDRPIDIAPTAGDPDAEQEAIKQILSLVYDSKKPSILVDGAVSKRRICADVESLVKKCGFPVFVTPMGKGSIDETLPGFVGLYAGAGSETQIKKRFEQSDLVISIGAIPSDLNSTGFTTVLPANTIALHYAYCLIGDNRIDNARFKSLIPRLIDALDESKLTTLMSDEWKAPLASIAQVVSPDSNDAITHNWLWPRMSTWFREGDLVITDTGTSYVGYWSSRLAKGTQIINQIVWSSIGYGVGATQGAALAAQEAGQDQRTICFEGDGSFQLTAQELSTIIRHDLNVTMFVIENDGYTIERFVHGLEESYNDIMQWKYDEVPHIFTRHPGRHQIRTWRIQTRTELEKLLSDAEFVAGRGLQFVEMHMDKLDAPQVLKDFGENAAKRAS